MQETTFFKDGMMRKHIEAFSAENQKNLESMMDTRLTDLEDKGHFLTGRRVSDSRVPKQIMKMKGRKGKRLRRAYRHAF